MASPAANRSREAIRVHTEILEAASRGEEVGGDHVRRVVAQESRPALAVVAAPAASGPRDHVPPDRPRRDPEAELGEQLVGDALLSPQGVLAAHLSDPPSKIRWNGRSSWPGLPPPEEPEAFALPTDQGLGSDHDESASPVQPAAEQTEHRILTRHRPARPLARARAGGGAELPVGHRDRLRGAAGERGAAGRRDPGESGGAGPRLRAHLRATRSTPSGTQEASRAR
jgi:hypothetical protein